MNKEEIDYWLKLFSDNNHAFMSKDGKKITLFKVFDKLKKLQQENQKLKKQLHEASLTIQEMTERDIECPSNCEKLRQLKKQLEDKTEDYKRMKDNFDSKVDVITEIDTQQKEFIKYLEDEKDRLIKETSHYYIDSFDRQHSVNETIYDEVNDILQKYKSIIGVSDEKVSN